MSTWQEFVTELSGSDVLNFIERQALDEWGGDIPTTVLFGKFGKAIVDHFGELQPERRAHIFRVIEKGLDDRDVPLKALVATGLLEALYLRAAGIPGRWDEIRKYLGPVSASYLMEWGNPQQ